MIQATIVSVIYGFDKNKEYEPYLAHSQLVLLKVNGRVQMNS